MIILIPTINGQMSNHLIIFSHGLATAIESGQTIINLSYNKHFGAKDYNRYFKLNTDGMNIKVYNPNLHFKIVGFLVFIIRAFRKIFKGRLDRAKYVKNLKGYNDTLKRKKRSLHLITDWHYRNYTDFVKHRDKIRQYFEWTDNCVEDINNRVSELRKNYDIIVGVHIRLGDYVKHLGGIYYYSIEEFGNWINIVSEELRVLNKKHLFVVFTNEREKIVSLSPNADLYFPDGGRIEDQYMMFKCDYLFGPPSTFSWWAAFMGNVKYHAIYDRNEPFTIDLFSEDIGWEDSYYEYEI